MTTVYESPSGTPLSLALDLELVKTVTVADFAGNETTSAELDFEVDTENKLPLGWLVVIEQAFALPESSIVCNMTTYPDGDVVDQSPSNIPTDALARKTFATQNKNHGTGVIHFWDNPLPTQVYFESDSAAMSQMQSGIMKIYMIYLPIPTV